MLRTLLNGIGRAKRPIPAPLNYMVTLWPSFPHFGRFSRDSRLSGIRLNSAMVSADALDDELAIVARSPGTVPLWFDVKARQLRVTEAIVKKTHLELRLNHPIEVQTPTPVLFKAGEDGAELLEVKDGGYHLVFRGGPQYLVKEGESLHIRHPSLKVSGDIYTDAEKQKIEKTHRAGFKKFFISYVESQRELDELRAIVGKDVELYLKIESMKGLKFVAEKFQKEDGVRLVAARGDLFVEVNKPINILKAMKLIINRDPEALAGSRMLLSLVRRPVPELADLADLAWMYDMGYRNMMLCDELCLKEEWLATSVNVLEHFRADYAKSI